MATGGGGGGAPSRGGAGEDCEGGGGADGGGGPPRLRAASPPTAASQKAWTSQGTTSNFDDPMSHYLSDLDGVQTEQWDLYIQFDGAKFVQKRMIRSEIRYLKLLSIMESEGYGLNDSIYFVKHEGEGLNGLELIDSHLKVEEMIRKYEHSKAVVLTVMKDRRSKAIVVSPLKRPRPSPVHVDLVSDDEQPIPFQMSTQGSVYCDYVHTQHDEHIPIQFGTQESVHCQRMQAEVEEQEQEETSGYSCTDDEEEEKELQKTIAESRKRKKDPMQHCEGETDVEDIFDIEEDAEVLASEKPAKKKPKRQGPTSRSHSQVLKEAVPQWVPSDDEEVDFGFIKVEDDDGYESLSFVQPNYL